MAGLMIIINCHILLCDDISRFKSSKNDHIIDVEPFDEIDFICPHYAPSDVMMSPRDIHDAIQHDIITHDAVSSVSEREPVDDDVMNHEYFLIYRVQTIKTCYNHCSISVTTN